MGSKPTKAEIGVNVSKQTIKVVFKGKKLVGENPRETFKVSTKNHEFYVL